MKQSLQLVLWLVRLHFSLLSTNSVQGCKLHDCMSCCTFSADS